MRIDTVVLMRKFIPDYDLKIVGSEDVIQWRFGAHPTIHAFTTTKSPRKSNDLIPQVPPLPGRAGRRSRVGGTLWADEHTGPIHKFPLPKVKKKPSGNENFFKITETQEIALAKELRRALQNVQHRHMKAILPSLRKLDHSKIGQLPFPKVKEVLQSNQISLGELGYQNLGKKFGKSEKDIHVVSYENLISYLTKLWGEAAALPKKKPSTPPAAGFSNRVNRIGDSKSVISRPSYVGLDQRIVHMRNKVMFRDQDEQQLLDELERELLACNSVNMADLRSTMYSYDRDRNNFINSGQVLASFRACGIHLSTALLQKLLRATDRTGAGAYNIETVINYLIRAVPSLQPELQIGGNYFPRESRVPVLPAISNQPMFSIPGFNASNSSSIDEELEENENEEENEEEAEETISLVEEEPFNPSRWSQDYSYLIEALHQADQDKYGFMPEKEVKRIARNYILVYNLGVSEFTLNEALRKAFDDSFKEVNLDHFTSQLQEIHFKTVTENIT